ncbi:unnamed protein product, partial [Pylaiella littoralis]
RSPWSQGRKLSAWEDGGRRGGAGPVLAARNRSSGGSGNGQGGSEVRGLPASTSRHLPSRQAWSSSPSPPPRFPREQYSPRRSSSAATGDDGFGSNRTTFPDSLARGGFEGVAEMGGDSAADGARRCISSAVAVGMGGDVVISSPTGNRKTRTGSTPVHAERFAQAARKADIERLLRRASQSHPPPDVQVREGDSSNSKGGDYCEDKGGSEADDKNEGSRPNNSNAPPPDPQKNTERGKGGGEEGGWRGLLGTALRRKEQATGTSSSARKEERQQGQPSNHHENGTFEVDGGGGGGSRDGAEDGVNVLGGGAVSPTTPTGTPTVVGSKTTAGKAAAPNGTGDDGHNN